jgi:predicted DNA-binding transcriptional regulator AlpA
MSKKTKTPSHVLTRADLLARGVTYSPNYLREMWSKGKFPKPYKLSERKLVWDADAIDQWFAKKLKEGRAS